MIIDQTESGSLGNSGLFLPRDLSGVNGWIETTDPSGNNTQPLDGSALVTLTDKSISGNNFGQDVGCFQPLFTKNVLNGRPVARFDGINDYMTSNFNLNYSPNSAVTIFCLYQLRSGGGQQGLWGQDDGSWDRFALLAHDVIGPGVSDGTTIIEVANMGNVGVWQLLTVQYQNGVTDGSQVWIDGVSQIIFKEQAHTNSGDTTMSIGRLGSSGLCANVDIAALVVLPRVCTALERQQIEFYINKVFGR